LRVARRARTRVAKVVPDEKASAERRATDPLLCSWPKCQTEIPRLRAETLCTYHEKVEAGLIGSNGKGVPFHPDDEGTS
jgi:hypothetical protein